MLVFPLISRLGLSGLNEIIAITTGFGAIGLGLYKYAARPIYKKYRKVIDTVMTGLKASERIMAELQPNGGGSFRDHLDRQFTRINERLTSSEKRTAMNTAFQRQGFGAEGSTSVFETNEAGKLVWANSVLTELTGLSIDDLRAGAGPMAIHAADQEAILDKWADCLRDGRPFLDTFRYVNVMTGKVYPVRCHVSPVHAGDTVVGWVGVIKPEPTNVVRASS